MSTSIANIDMFDDFTQDDLESIIKSLENQFKISKKKNTGVFEFYLGHCIEIVYDFKSRDVTVIV